MADSIEMPFELVDCVGVKNHETNHVFDGSIIQGKGQILGEMGWRNVTYILCLKKRH